MRRRHRRHRRERRQRRFVLASGGAALAVMAVAAPLWACVPIQGVTWYSDSVRYKAGPAGTYISAYATGARPNLAYLLVSGRYTGPGEFAYGCTDNSAPINPNLRYSNTRGFVATTSGPVNRPQGDWQVCFKEAYPPGTFASWFTSPVFFTVV